jgi:hypothetical protein
MRIHVARLGAALGLALLLLGTAADPRPGPPPVPPDTLAMEGPAGTPLVRSLPAELRGVPVSGYAMLRGPALAGVAGRSLTWIPKGAGPGPHDLHLEARHPETAPDTVVVRITLTES